MTDAYIPDSDAGLAPESPTPDLTGLNHEEAVQAIVDWFAENYVDPVHYVSYISREGGYQYVYGPYDAREVIYSNFSSAPDDVIEAALDQIQNEAIEWVPSENRLTRDEDDERASDETYTVDTAALHARMQSEASETRKILESIRNELAGIGHNNPPSPISEQPLANQDLQEVNQLIDLLKSQPQTSATNAHAVVQASGRLRTFAQAIGAYLAVKADTFIDAAAKSAGTKFGQEGLPSLWHRLGELLATLADTAMAWIDSILPML